MSTTVPTAAPILTPDQRLRVFVSSTLGELAAERRVVRAAIERLRLAPVMFELGARPHPPRSLYRAYLEQSHIFVGIYWQSYGWVAPGEEVSGLEDEYNLSGKRPKLIYVKGPAPDREPRLKTLLSGIRDDDQVSYKGFSSARELRQLVENDLVLLLTERFEMSRVLPESRPDGSVTAAARTPTLPLPPTQFVGREREMDGLVAMLADPDIRLVTLSGPGGIGKTRLALETAARLGAEFPDGVWFVPLATVTDPSLVDSAIAQALGIDESGELSVRDALKGHLSGRRMLLLLDNFEQVVSGAEVISEILASAPGLKILVTSRAVLRLAGEYDFPVPPLSVASMGGVTDGGTVSQYDAVRLFIQRAGAVKPDFKVTNDNAPAVAEICHRLDGLPLAIELAAARVRLLPPQAMLSRLDSRLKLLTSGAKDLPARQQTLRGAIDWSHSLLTPEEQRLLARLAVFAGGCTLEAAELICNADGDLDVLELMESLTDKSLLRQTNDGAEPRLVMLQTIHEYASEKLAGNDEVASLRQRHAAYYLELAEAARAQLRGPQQAERLRQLAAEHGNLRLALGWLIESDNPEAGLRLAGRLWLFWGMRAHLSEGRRWLEAALAKNPQAPAALRSEALTGLGRLTADQGDYSHAMVHLEAALELSRGTDHRENTAYILSTMAIVHQYQGNYDCVEPLLQESLDLSRQIGDAWGVAAVLNVLGTLALGQGDYARAVPLFEESLAHNRRIGGQRDVSVLLNNLGIAAMEQGEVARAIELLQESLVLSDELEDWAGVYSCLEELSMAEHSQGEIERSTRLYAAADALRTTLGAPMPPDEMSRFERLRSDLRSRMGQAAFNVAWNEGRALEKQQAVDYALDTMGGSHASAVHGDG